MKRITIILLFLLLGSKILQAQPVYRLKPDPVPSATKRTIHWSILAGYNLGATTPLSMPNTIRRVNAWWPTFNPSIGLEATKALKQGWSMGGALKLEYKGMGTKDEVQYFHTILDVTNGSEEGVFEGDFSGRNQTVVHNLYATLPVYAIYHVKKTRFQLGLYAAALIAGKFKGKVYDGYIRKGNSLGEKVTLNEASFDFSNHQNRFDYGIMGGVQHQVRKQWSVRGDVNWGIARLFPGSFNGVEVAMQNIYLTLGICYQLD